MSELSDLLRGTAERVADYRVVAGEERHATIDRSLRLLGIGADAVEPIAADDNGAIDPEALARALDESGRPIIVS